MTIVQDTATTTASQPLRPVAFDLYRDIHKGIRAELFALTGEAGRVDPSDTCSLVALDAQVRSVVDFLVAHAEHEDGVIQPALEARAPELAAAIAHDHETLEARMVALRVLAAALVDAPDRRRAVHELYVEVAAFTGAYLFHQDLEERVVGPALEVLFGVEGVLDMHGRIIAAISPQAMGEAMAIMLPAMNVDDRTEMLGGIRATAPAEAFAAMRGLASSVLTPADFRAVDERLARG